MAQFARPDADQATGTWTSTPLWSKIDEGATGDDVVITSDDNTSPDNADVRLSDVTDPSVGSGHIIRAQWNKSAAGGNQTNAICELWEGIPGTGTLRATLTVNNISDTVTDSEYTLSAGEANAIGDYTDLYLRISRQGTTGGPPGGRRALVVDFAELEVPDASSFTSAQGAASGTGAASGDGAATAEAIASASGAGAATGAGGRTVETTGTAAGAGSAASVSSTFWAGVGTAAGTGAAASVSSTFQTGAGTATGTGSAAGVGLSTGPILATGTATGTGAAAGIGYRMAYNTPARRLVIARA